MVRTYKRKTERGSYGSEKLSYALAAVEGGMPLKTAAKEFDIPPRSLRRHRDGKVSQPGLLTMGKTKSTLPDYVEKELHDHIQFMEKRLYGLTTNDVRKLAFEVAEKSNIQNPFNKETRMAGKDWLRGFFARHQDLRLREPEGTSVARAVGFNRPKVREFFGAYKDVINTVNSVRPSNIWNMDETGISNVQKPARIIATKGCRQVGKMTSAERGITVTVICAMSAAGVHLPPMFIFPRKRMVDTLLNGAPPQSIGFCSPKGWTDSDLFLKWLEHFVQFTNCSTNAPQIVILDGHHSHKSLQAILYAREHGVHLITLPPHSTNKIQPLDRSYFKSLKSAYNAQADSWMVSHPGRRISAYDMTGIFAKAFLKTATPEKAVRGFETCGIWPYNENIFSDDDFCAAEVTEETQPIDQSSNESSENHGPSIENIDQEPVVNQSLNDPDLSDVSILTSQHLDDMNACDERILPTQSTKPSIDINLSDENNPSLNDILMSDARPQSNPHLDNTSSCDEHSLQNKPCNDIHSSNNDKSQSYHGLSEVNMTDESPKPNRPYRDINACDERSSPNEAPYDRCLSREHVLHTPRNQCDMNLSDEHPLSNQPTTDVNLSDEFPFQNQNPSNMNSCDKSNPSKHPFEETNCRPGNDVNLSLANETINIMNQSSLSDIYVSNSDPLTKEKDLCDGRPNDDISMTIEQGILNQSNDCVNILIDIPKPSADMDMSYGLHSDECPRDINLINQEPQPTSTQKANNEIPQFNIPPVELNNEPKQPANDVNVSEPTGPIQIHVDNTMSDTAISTGLEKIIVNGDGRCLFRSISIGMDQSLQTAKRNANGHAIDSNLRSIEEAKSDSLRKSMVEYMNKNIHMYDNLEISAINADLPKRLKFNSINDRIKAMTRPKVMPGELELIALTNVLEKPIIILSEERRVLADYGSDKFHDNQPLFVEFTSVGRDVGHYNCLISPDRRATEPSEKIKNIIQFLSPPPKLSGTRSRKRKAESASVLTSSPYKNALVEKQRTKSKNQGKEIEEKSKKGNSKRRKTTSITKPKTQRKKSSNKNGKKRDNKKHTITYSSDENEEVWPCIICCEPFSTSNGGEEWVQCQICMKWAHDECTPGYLTFICPNCESDED